VNELLTGANPNLFYLSIGLFVGGIIGMLLIKLIAGSIIQSKVAASLRPPKPEAGAPPPRTQNVVIGRRVYPAGGGPSRGSLFGGGFDAQFAEADRRINAQRKVVSESGGIILFSNLLYYACWFSILAGGVGGVVDLVQRYNVV
jgi:hypothetical protein